MMEVMKIIKSLNTLKKKNPKSGVILKIKGWEGIFISFLKNYVVCVNHSVVSDSLRPHGLQLTRLLCPWNSPGKNTGVDSHSLLQGNFPTQVSHIAGR